MTVEDCYQLGYITKPHGLRGEVQAKLDVDFPKQYSELESVFVLQGQQLVPFFIESLVINQDKALIGFEEIETLDQAKALKGLQLYLPLDALPELDEGQFYYHEIQGFDLIDESIGKVGQIERVIDAGSQVLMSVMHSSGKEILVPIVDDLMKKLDRENKELHMSLPEGLIDIYLND